MKTVSKTINAKLDEFKELNDDIKGLEKQRDSIKEELKSIMDEKETKVIVGLNNIATLSPQIRKSLNKALVQELIGDKIKACMKATQYDVFKVVGA